MKLDKLSFHSKDLDSLMIKWISVGLSPSELKEWKSLLTYNSKLREEFADWIKALRDPGWGSERKRRRLP